MALDTTIIQAIAPNLYAEHGEDKCLFFLGQAEGVHDPVIWGTTSKYAAAMSYYALHLLELAIGGDAPYSSTGAKMGVSGPVKSRKSLALAETYADASTAFSGSMRISVADYLLITTPWGRQYLTVRETLAQIGPTTTQWEVV